MTQKPLKASEKNIIDTYYNELDVETLNSSRISGDDLAFKEGFTDLVSTMSILETPTFETPNNFFNLINKAEAIRQRKQFKKEFTIFLLAASFVVSIFSTIILIVGPTPLIIFEAVVFTLLPFSLIPLSKAALNRGEVK